jgi:hypothetical protein
MTLRRTLAVARPTDPVTAVTRLRASELVKLPRGVWEPIVAAAAASVAAEYRADPESAAFDAFVFEAQYIDGGRVPPRASELLRWPPHLRDYYLTEAASQVAAAYRADPEANAFEAFQHESQFLD